MSQLKSEIHAVLKAPTLFDKVRDRVGAETDQLLDKGKTTYVAKKTYDSLPQNVQATLPKPLQDKLGSVAWFAFGSLLERMSKNAGIVGGLMSTARALPGAAKTIATGATEAGMHKNEIAGLGVLAVPGLDTLQASVRARLAGDKGHDAVEKRHLLGEGAHAALDVGGLGMLAAPAIAKLKHAFSQSSYSGNVAQNGPGMKGHSAIPAFTAPELAERKIAACAEELLTHKLRAAGKSAEETDRIIGEGKTAGMGVGAGMSTSQYSGPLSLGTFKQTSGIPAFSSPAMAEKKASIFDVFLAALLEKDAAPASAAARLNSTQAVGAPKTTAPPGPSISQVSKPHGYGTPLAGTTKTIG